VLVSRRWTGKTLTEHRADRAAVVRAALEEAGIDPDDHDELSVSGTDGRWSWETIARTQVDDATYLAAVAALVRTRDRWRRQYDEARARAETSGFSATPGGP
jgi:8-oxo-dGTP pyrophosphatase MutT (NUDIX family)